jgi:hypothetical protein
MVELPAMTKDEWARFDQSMKMMEELQAPTPAAAPQKAAVKELDWPPGVTGALAQAIYHNSARPVQTVAIATALAILAGVCGRGWITYTNAGLNLYLAVVARSGIGKEAIGDAIPTLVRDAVKAGERGASSFFTFLSMASGRGCSRPLQTRPMPACCMWTGSLGTTCSSWRPTRRAPMPRCASK